MLPVRRLHNDAVLPVRAHPEDAGMDLTTIESVTLPPGKSVMLATGWAISIPTGQAGIIEPRSKLSSRKGLTVLARVIDSPYREEIVISMINVSDKDIEIRKGDKVAQLVVHYISLDNPVEVDFLPETERGAKGIKSTEMRT